MTIRAHIEPKIHLRSTLLFPLTEKQIHPIMFCFDSGIGYEQKSLHIRSISSMHMIVISSDYSTDTEISYHFSVILPEKHTDYFDYLLSSDHVGLWQEVVRIFQEHKNQ